MNLTILGNKIKKTRLNKNISLNKMSKDLYGYRYRVNHLSNIEQGKVDISFTQLILILNYLEIDSLKLWEGESTSFTEHYEQKTA